MLIACCVPYFNTSHVTVYLTHYQTGISITIFQYISCYCLSLLPFRLYDPVLLFQYISCYCLSSPGFNVGLSYSRFQYISCYCLSLIGVHFQRGHRISIHLMLLFIISGFIIPRVKCHFNTSHVTVYLGHRVMELIKDIFQYISCYCLSLNTSSVLIPFLISIHLMLLFILLPVCSLLCMSRISIHLMLLFIEFGRFLNKLSDHFNTSHVTVYLPKDETEEIDV